MNGASQSIIIEPGSLSEKKEKPSLDKLDEDGHPETQDLAEMEKFILKEAEERGEDEVYPHGRCSRWVEKIEDAVGDVYRKYKTVINIGFKIIALALFLAYFIYCVSQRYFDEGSYILTVLTALLVLKIIVSRLWRPSCTRCFTDILIWYGTSRRAHTLRKILRYGLYLLATGLLVAYLSFNMASRHTLRIGQAVFGIFTMIFMCFVTSYKPSKVNWHPVFWGFVIQFAFAALTLRTETGYNIFKWIGDIIYNLVRLSDSGSTFVLGASFLADKAGFFFDCTGVMVFFNACIFLMEYYGVLEFIVLKIGRGLALCLETGPVESVVAAANIFIGLSEAPLLVRPYLPTVTKSELHAIMTCGFSSISGAFMAMFIKVGAPASHLLTAAVISAPAALAITKLMYPEVEAVNYASQRNIKMRDDSKHRNALQAFSDGALFSIKLVAAIMVNMLAFVSMLSLLNAILIWLGERANIENMTFQWLCSYLFYPLSFMMGTEPEDCGKVGALIGLKLMATPFVAYADLGKMIQNRHILEQHIANNGTWYWSGNDIKLNITGNDTISTLELGVMQYIVFASPIVLLPVHARWRSVFYIKQRILFINERSEVITTYALCGISAFPAIGFTMGTLIPMSPERKNDIVSVVIRSFIAGNLANIITGSVAGVMYTGH